MASPFEDDATARQLLEALRWSDGSKCPRCGSGGTEVFLIGGEKYSHREGLHQCKPCRRQFSVMRWYVERRGELDHGMACDFSLWSVEIGALLGIFALYYGIVTALGKPKIGLTSLLNVLARILFRQQA